MFKELFFYESWFKITNPCFTIVIVHSEHSAGLALDREMSFIHFPVQ